MKSFVMLVSKNSGRLALQHILELSGLQASGKTTIAKQSLNEIQGIARVNKDDLRQMLRGDGYSLRDERLVVAVEKAAARAILDEGYSLIVDDTNLSKSNHWKDLAQEFGIKHEVIKLDVSLEDCIRRDSLREKPVGAVVIRATAKRVGNSTDQ